MSQSVENPKQEQGKGQTVRVIGQIMKVEDPKTSAAGNQYQRLSVVVNDGINKDGTWWNLTLMDNLKQELVKAGAEELLAKFRYAKFIGLGSQRPWQDKEGKTRTSNDMLVSSIELQNGTLISTRKEKQSEDEDAPF